MKVITVGSTKGGVGKSTISVNMAVEAAKEGKRILLIDTDPQGSSLDFRRERESEDIKAIGMVSDKIHKDIGDFENSFDLVVIDAGGRDNGIFRSALAACDLFVLPIPPSQFDVWAAEDSIAAFKEISDLTNCKGLIVLNMLQERTKVAKEVMEALGEVDEYLPLFRSHLHHRVLYKNSVSQGQGVSEFEPNSKAGREFKEFYDEVMERLS